MRSKWQQVAPSSKGPEADVPRDPVSSMLAGSEPADEGIPEAWIGIDEAARYLSLPIRTLYLLAQRRQVAAVKVGRTWRFKRSALDAGLDGDDSLQTVTALAELSVELGALGDPAEIAQYVSARLRAIFEVELVGLMRLEAGTLETLLPSDALALPAGTRFTLSKSEILRRAVESDVPTAFDDLGEHTAPTNDIVSRFGIRSAMFVPIRVAGTTWGLLSLATLTPRHFSSAETDRLVSIASQAGLALNNARLLAETRRWSEQLERIEALTAQLSRSRAVGDVADAVAREIDSVIDWHGLRFYVLDADGQTLEPIKLCSKVDHYAHETPDLVRLRLGEGLGGHIAASGVPEVINNAALDPRGARIPGTDDTEESMIVVPLIYEDAVLGALELFRLGLDAFDATDLRLAQIVGAQAAVALSNARQLEEMERRRDALERRVASQRQLLAITERLLAQRERGAVFEAIADTLAEVVPHDTLTIYLVDDDAGCLVPILARDEYAEQILASRPAIGSGITGDVIAHGEAEIINDATNDPRVVHVPGTPTDQDESMIVAPIRNADGVVGALNLYRVGRDFDGDDLELVRLFTNHVAIALDNATIHDQLVDAAVTDPLTGLPNRRLFAEQIDHALARRYRSATHVAVLFLDLDSFKMVNDGLGHAAGDGVLRGVAERLRECTRQADTVARLGGDEFGILLEDVKGEADAKEAAERVVAALSGTLSVDGRTVRARASIGVALDRGEPNITSVELLRDADTAMYLAKAANRGSFEVFEPTMHARQLARLQLDSELREALDLGQFNLNYQPIINFPAGRIIGAEALLRWNHPTRAIGPLEFIELAEESGEIVTIGAWVLREACHQARRWQLELPGARDLRISVNVSARELVEAAFVEGVESALSESGLSAGSLALEITESMMLADETAAIAALRRLRKIGVHIVVDDFGTGYSSLSYLKRLPVDGLKIDRSFVEGLGEEREKSAIVRATIALARALGLTVTAEGIENAKQVRRLLALQCDLGQGYHFAPPLEPEALTDLLAKRHQYRLPVRASTKRGAIKAA
jgi:diguanylate cyclase (GGDEF)-like protein/excisionase family DNA binding protein